jgi:hypothetical protein
MSPGRRTVAAKVAKYVMEATRKNRIVTAEAKFAVAEQSQHGISQPGWSGILLPESAFSLGIVKGGCAVLWTPQGFDRLFTALQASWLVSVFALLLSSTVSHCQTRERVKNADEIANLLERSEGLPVPLRIDVQLRIIESGKLPHSVRVVPYLEELLQHISAIPDVYPAVPVDFGSESLEKESGRALALYRLDRSSLKLRIIKALLPYNRTLANHLFLETNDSPDQVGCSQSLIPSLSSYYGELAKTAAIFRKPNDQFLWLDDQLRSVHSPLQLAGMGNLLVSVPHTRDKFAERISIYKNLLQRMRATDRELSSIEQDGSIESAIRGLIEECRRYGLSPLPLLESYRGFLVGSMREPPCAQFSTSAATIQASFNSLRNLASSSSTPPPIALESIKRPDTQKDVLQIHRLENFTSFEPDLITLYKLYSLRAPSDDVVWSSAISAFLRHIDSFDPDQKSCQECAYFEEAKALTHAFDYAPKGTYKENLLERLVTLLANSPAEQRLPSLWLYQVEVILNLARPVPKAQENGLIKLIATGNAVPLLPSSIAPKIRETFERSGNRALEIYAAADQVLGTQFDSPFLRQYANP